MADSANGNVVDCRSALEGAVKVVWGLSVDQVEWKPVLSGTNNCFFLTVDGQKYHLRIANPNSGLLAINRTAEERALLAVSAIGLAPQPVMFVHDKGILVTRFVEGRVANELDLFCNGFLRKMAASLTKVHNLPDIGIRFSPYQQIKERLAKVDNVEKRFGIKVSAIVERLDRIEAQRLADTDLGYRLCHNDLFAQNIMKTKGVCILDWEMAGMGDVYYDLATFLFDVPSRKWRFFLKCYFGSCNDAMVATMKEMVYVVSIWNATWAMVQIRDNSPINYEYYAQKFLADADAGGFSKWVGATQLLEYAKSIYWDLRRFIRKQKRR